MEEEGEEDVGLQRTQCGVNSRGWEGRAVGRSGSWALAFVAMDPENLPVSCVCVFVYTYVVFAGICGYV